jgi:hypothetical protein
MALNKKRQYILKEGEKGNGRKKEMAEVAFEKELK